MNDIIVKLKLHVMEDKHTLCFLINDMIVKLKLCVMEDEICLHQK